MEKDAKGVFADLLTDYTTIIPSLSGQRAPSKAYVEGYAMLIRYLGFEPVQRIVPFWIYPSYTYLSVHWKGLCTSLALDSREMNLEVHYRTQLKNLFLSHPEKMPTLPSQLTFLPHLPPHKPLQLPPYPLL